MKVILNYDPVTGQITDRNGVVIMTWMSLQYEDVEQVKPEPIKQEPQQMGAEELIRIMKISAHINNPSKIKDI